MSSPSRKSRILVVDDEPGVRALLQAVVEGFGADVEFAEDGHIAFRKATQIDYDLILMDLNMPDWNGMDTIRSLKLIQPDRKVIVISGFLSDAIISELNQESNVYGVFRKPFEVDELVSCIQKALS